MIQVIKLRLRDKHTSQLNAKARACNYVWNFCNETQQKAVKSKRKWLNKYDLQKLTAGSSKMLGLHAHTVQQICHKYDDSRKTHKKAWLKWRGRKTLGWVPFNQGHVKKIGENQYKFNGAVYQTMHDRASPEGAIIRAGSFNQDAKGHWYLNIPVSVEPVAIVDPDNSIGIDLGLKDLANMSDGSKIANPRHFRALEEKLGKAQRAGKKKLARNIHQKIKNSRKDYLHKASKTIADTYGTIVVGDVSSKKLSQTKMAKSVMDVGWSDFKNMLHYKSIRNGGVMIEVSEYLSTQICSACGCLPESRPRGIADIGIREWQCTDCGTHHDRDTNAATNILRVGLHTLKEGASK